jgi:hypothetical protein
MSVVFDGDSYFHVSVKKNKMLGLLLSTKAKAREAIMLMLKQNNKNAKAQLYN